MKVDCAIIGGGIVGLSVALQLGRRQPGVRIVVLEKETQLASHQTGRNSGVIHSGIYYPPGSLKARFAREGNRSMIAFCQEHEIAHDVCGKIIVATRESELPLLHELHRRGVENQLTVTELSAEEVREIEPHVACLRGLSVPSTAIVSYREVCVRFADLIAEQGGCIQTEAEVRELRHNDSSHTLETARGTVEAKFLVNCGGLQSDRLALGAGLPLEARITPFRGEYYELVPERRHLVNSLVYPVPDPSFPFLGVHFTRMIDGSVHAGPNAVLALKREGYAKTDIDLRDVWDTLSYRGFWNLARKHYKEGFAEAYRSLNKRAFVKSLQQLIPEVSEKDIVPAPAGVRAQALLPSGALVNDFLLVHGPQSIHVCNAPSPAATASLEIGKEIAEKIPQLRTSTSVHFASNVERRTSNVER
ncbi:MAG: L-2-hydroxyglutarate oxidase [Chthoniobacterales bacterium]|nr:L-2-hydroxyglutarate oxidase [Chthoniobacterales bacterium]